jgi:RNA polymerase sigma-70 factor (ECF subfamily)
VQEWVRRIAAGDQQAIAEAFTYYRNRLRRLVLLRLDRRLQGRVDASDILQEAYLDVAHRAAEYAANPSLPLFLWLRLLTGQRLLRRRSLRGA